MAAGDTRKVLLQNNNGENLIPYTEVASSTTAGRVKPDGTSTTVDANGVISVASSIQSGAAAGATAVQPSGVGNAEIEIQKNGTRVDSFTTNQSGSKQTINITVPTQASDVSALPASTKYGASIDLSLNQTDYKLTFTLKDQDGTALNSKVVDFPIENVVVGGSYDSTNQKIVLTLQNGTTIDVPVGALISGLQSEITSANKLDADLVDDSTSTNKFVTTSEKSTWSGKQDTLVSGTNIKTINNNSILGSGNINITASATWGNITGPLSDQTDLQTVLNAKAGLADNNTFSGTNSFTSYVLSKSSSASDASSNRFTAQSLQYTWGTTPSGTISNQFQFWDSTGAWTGLLTSAAYANGSVICSVTCRNRAKSAAEAIGIGYDANDNVFTFAPTPATADNSTKMATTAYVKNQGYIGTNDLATCHVIVNTYRSGTNWYRIYSDGWIEQGGRLERSATGIQNVTFLKPFADLNYNVQATNRAAESYTSASTFYPPYTLNHTVNGFSMSSNAAIASIKYFEWVACGMGA